MTTINPYIYFNGTCEKAFYFYRLVFGGNFSAFRRFKEIPGDVSGNYKTSASEGEKIRYIALPVGNNAIIMGSDYPEKSDQIIEGNNFSISIDTDSEELAKRYFNELSTGGKVIKPLDKIWDSLFGILVDKFGIQWMVGYSFEYRTR